MPQTATRPANLQVAKRPLDRQAADILREQILSGRFPPGMRLLEVGLAQQLGVSRGTLRAALSELAHQGLVEQVAYTKWFVPALTPEDAWELYTLRSSLEGLAANLAATQRSAEGSAQLEAAFERLRTAVARDRRGAAAAADSELHKTIVRVAGHRRLMQQYRLIEQQVQRYIASSNALLTSSSELIEQHAPLVRAILGGQGDRAERLAREHNITEGRVLAAHLEKLAAGRAAAIRSKQSTKQGG